MTGAYDFSVKLNRLRAILGQPRLLGQSPVTLTFDGADGTSMVLEYPPGLDWEVGCGSIEEAADLPHPDSLVFWAASGQATLELTVDEEDDWMWRGTLTLDGVVFVDEEGRPCSTSSTTRSRRPIRRRRQPEHHQPRPRVQRSPFFVRPRAEVPSMCPPRAHRSGREQPQPPEFSFVTQGNRPFSGLCGHMGGTSVSDRTRRGDLCLGQARARVPDRPTAPRSTPDPAPPRRPARCQRWRCPRRSRSGC